MLEMRLRGGPSFRPENATITITLPDDPEGRVWSWEDVDILAVYDPEFRIVEGKFGAPGAEMPIRGIHLHDASDLVVQVPMALADARAIGEKLMTPTVKVAQSVPSALSGISLPKGTSPE